jgi:uncharacterized protein involved in type VI secretion and phage assembly
VFLHSYYTGNEAHDAQIEARICVPMAGGSSGAFFVPDVGDEVVVACPNGDPRNAVVVGSVWNGRHSPPETMGDRVDRWTMVGKKGTRIAIEEEGEGAIIRLSTKSGDSDVAFITINREGMGKIELSAGGTTVRIDSQGCNINTSGSLETNASSTRMCSATMDVEAGQSSFTGPLIASASVQTPSVVGGTYTPGGGNVW